MMTRDIDLEGCVLDLVDNSVDEATRSVATRTAPESMEDAYRGFQIDLIVGATIFSIKDNCGGMSIKCAKTIAFHFGKPDVSPEGESSASDTAVPSLNTEQVSAVARDSEFVATEAIPHADDVETIGVYGIGMKRSIFKLGKKIRVVSSTANEGFTVEIDVDAWERETKGPWHFNLNQNKPAAIHGLGVYVDELEPQAARELGQDVFINKLRRSIARDYAFFIQRGLVITVNELAVAAYEYKLKEDSSFKPFRVEYEDNGVRVQITAGLAGLPLEDDSPEGLKLTPTERFGWFVLCNDRVVIAADKSSQTVWDRDGFAVWHPQYNGFMGIAAFYAKDRTLLPFDTTKRRIVAENAVYLRAVARMKNATDVFIAYTNSRKPALEEAKNAEKAAQFVSISKVANNTKMEFPKFVSAPPVTYVSVQYTVTRKDLKSAAAALGKASMPATKVGSATFQYFLDNEVEN
jgi:hypothetical protein